MDLGSLDLGRLRRQDFEVRPYRDGDEAQILDLFETCFHHRRSLDHWRWEFLRNPYSPRPRIVVATAPNGRIVAHYAAYLNHFYEAGRPGGRTLLAQQVGDTMTLPAVRHIGRGQRSLLARCALSFYEHFGEGQVAFNYGTNVGNIQKFSQRFLRAENVETVPFRRLDLDAEVRARLGREVAHGWRNGWSVGWALRTETGERPDFPDARWDRLFERVRDTYGFLSCRDARYVRWRYLQRPGFDYLAVALLRWRRLVGWGIFRREGERLLWGDALIDPRYPEAVVRLLHSAVQSPAGQGAASVEGWFPDRPAWLSAELDRLGLRWAPEPSDLSLMCVPFTEPDSAQRLRRLYYTMGDSDLF